MLMDHFIKESDIESAALCAHEVMLQEMCDSELTLAASLFSCVRCSLEAKDQLVQEGGEGEGEAEEKRLVYFKRQQHDDEHFDLKSVRQLNGKTIWFAAFYSQTAPEALKASCQLYGLLLYKKFDQVVSEFERVYLSEKKQVFAFLVEEVNKEVEQMNDSDRERYENSLAKWADLKQLCENDNGEQLVEKDVLKELEAFLKSTAEAQEAKDIEEQGSLFSKWEGDQKIELQEQIKKFNVELKKSSILKRLGELEQQEEVLTYFDHRSEIVNLYHDQGFAKEDPSLIPIEPEETQFKIKFERHFKPYQKYAKRPEHTLRMSNNQKDTLESLKKIYFDNSQAQTMHDIKWTSKK